MTADDQVHVGNATKGGALPSFRDLLNDVKELDEEAPDHKVDPAAAFRFVYDRWVKRGDYERGKPRHSVRQIKEWLDDRQVRSLETKLAGKTRLQFEDAFILLKLFLSFWTYNKSNNSYIPYSMAGLDELAKHLLQELFPGDVKTLLLPERSRKANSAILDEASAKSSLPVAITETRPSGELIGELFEESDALVTVSRVRSILGSDQAKAMTGFSSLMSELYEIDQRDHRKRSVIWVIDFGLRNDKDAARGAIYNVHFLAVQFRAIALIDTVGREQLFNWLQQNVCIVVGSLSLAEIDTVYRDAGVKLPPTKDDLTWFLADRIFGENIPHRWLDAPGSSAFDLSQAELWKAPTITVHLRLRDWNLDHDRELDVRRNLKYVFHGVVRSSYDDDEATDVRCIPLPEPGSRISDAYRLACNASFGRLGRPSDERLGPVGTPLEALAQLRDQHFAALRLDEFLRLPDLLISHGNAFLSDKSDLTHLKEAVNVAS